MSENETCGHRQKKKAGRHAPMRWVTAHWDIMGGWTSVEFHETKDDALSHFRREYKRFFDIAPGFKPKTAPCSYGFSHRKYMCVSVRTYNKLIKEG